MSLKNSLTLASIIAIRTTISNLNVFLRAVFKRRATLFVWLNDQLKSGIDAFINGAIVWALPNVASSEFLVVRRAKRRDTLAAALIWKSFVDEVISACSVAFHSPHIDMSFASSLSYALVDCTRFVEAWPRFVDRQKQNATVHIQFTCFIYNYN